jgi:GNAT superfamily N-acetyltransferase
MGGALAIRLAAVGERAALEALQRRASMHWGRYRDQLAAHPDAIQIPDEQFEQGLVRVAEEGEQVVGFSVLLPASGGACELDGIFVEPERMGTGAGRALIEDATRIAGAGGAQLIEVIANPEALGFYRRLGFTGDDAVPTRFGPGHRMRLEVRC